MLDILIKNGTVIDGKGTPGFVADVAVQNGRIEEIGGLAGERAKAVIDATGRYVTPGFIDITNHADVTAALFRFPSLESLALQGITTIIGGNCGTSLAPLSHPDVIHAIRKWSGEIVNVNWFSVGEFLAEVEQKKLALNFGTLVGHGTLRRGITNEALRPLSLEELTKFKFVLGEAMDEGALGISANLAAAHERNASTEEMVDIVKVVGARGGVYKSHLRHEGRELIPAVNEALRIGAEAETPVSISHLKAIGRKAWPHMRQVVSMIDNAARGGGRIIYDVSPYTRTGSQLHTLLPSWAREGGFHAMIERLKDPATRLNVIRELNFLTLHFDRIRIAEASDGISPGKTIAEIASRMGIDPNAAIIEILLANRGRVSIIGKTLARKNIEIGIRGRNSAISSNGSAYSLENPEMANVPHPRSFGAFPHYLHRAVRDSGVLSWEEALRKITSLPGECMRIPRRGVVQKNFYADLVVLNPQTLQDRATYKNPWRAPVGIEHVLVNGVPIVTDGKITSERPGQVIRKT
ncbi:MAG: amidohydrolase family protein [Candidatus Sungbacteria bacterium]|nr:amidohydrolase family protein [Candidatus Sungbacteria bacterium]